MADNAQKTPFGRSMQRFVGQVSKLATHITGKSLPATIVETDNGGMTVNYELTGDPKPHAPRVPMPVLGSRYVREPFQVGEPGMTVSADAYMGGMSGRGGGTADLTQRGNLATSAWAAVGNTSWPTVDKDTLVLTGGPSGVLIRDSETAHATITLTTSEIFMSCGGHTIRINSTGVIIDGRVFLDHVHKDTQPGSGDSGPPL